jgi:tryptophan synthase alpha chain
MRFGEGLGTRPGPRPKLVAYFMVDRARRRSFRRLAIAARDAGADALELGFPFSDPIADGPVLQAVADRALHHGTTWRDLLDAVSDTSPILPTAVMTYANPVWRRGLDRGILDLRRAGAGGLIVPDLPLEEAQPWKRSAEKAGVDLIMLAAPGANAARARSLAKASSGFLYLVARYGTTGTAGGMASGLGAIVRAAHAAAPRLPVIIGFGIHDGPSARRALRTGADGVVVATALEEALGRSHSVTTVKSVLRPIRRALAIRPG